MKGENILFIDGYVHIDLTGSILFSDLLYPYNTFEQHFHVRNTLLMVENIYWGYKYYRYIRGYLDIMWSDLGPLPHNISPSSQNCELFFWILPSKLLHKAKQWVESLQQADV